MQFGEPEPLRDEHDVANFESGEPSLDDWLTQRAIKSQSANTARTFIVTELENKRAIGYVSLASGSVRREQATRAFARNAPDPIPVAILARLAVDLEHQGIGLGTTLLIYSLKQVVTASKHVAIKAVVVNPISESATEFYKLNGFRAMPKDESTLHMTLAEIQATLAEFS